MKKPTTPPPPPTIVLNVLNQENVVKGRISTHTQTRGEEEEEDKRKTCFVSIVSIKKSHKYSGNL